MDVIRMWVGNTNTKRCHNPSCRAVPTIYPEHIQHTENGIGFPVLCKICGVQGEPSKSQTKLEDFKMSRDISGYLDNDCVKCEDERYKKLFNLTGCINCGCTEGEVLQYRHDGGVEVSGYEGKWWVFLVCEKCGYETSHVKALNKLERIHREGLNEK